MKKLTLALSLVAAIAISGCSKETKKDDELNTDGAIESSEMGDSDSGNAQGLQTINFAYDSDILGSRAKSVLRANADVLKDKASIQIQIEGHCDERGSVQYNIALGERRASAVKNYLVDLGIASDRITTVSFGKERPIDASSSESAWAKNRRANFVITAR